MKYPLKAVAQRFLESVATKGMHHHTGPTLEDNFRRYGVAVGAQTPERYRDIAKQFYQDMLESDDPLCSREWVGQGQLHIAYNRCYRGTFTRQGKPLSFMVVTEEVSREAMETCH